MPVSILLIWHRDVSRKPTVNAPDRDYRGSDENHRPSTAIVSLASIMSVRDQWPPDSAQNQKIHLDQQAATQLVFCLIFAVDRSNHPLCNGRAMSGPQPPSVFWASPRKNDLNIFSACVPAHPGHHRKSGLKRSPSKHLRAIWIALPGPSSWSLFDEKPDKISVWASF